MTADAVFPAFSMTSEVLDVWEVGVGAYAQYHTVIDNQRGLLYSTGNHTQYTAINYMGIKPEK